MLIFNIYPIFVLGIWLPNPKSIVIPFEAKVERSMEGMMVVTLVVVDAGTPPMSSTSTLTFVRPSLGQSNVIVRKKNISVVSSKVSLLIIYNVLSKVYLLILNKYLVYFFKFEYTCLLLTIGLAGPTFKKVPFIDGSYWQ